jgi:hypothetical protein
MSPPKNKRATKTEELPNQLHLPLDGKADLSPATQIRSVSRAFRITFNDIGGKRQLDDSQKLQVSSGFDANMDRLDLSKKLVNAKHPAIKKKNAAKSEILACFKSRTLPYPEAGIRLLPIRSKASEEQLAEVDSFTTRIRELIENYYSAVADLQNEWTSVVNQARNELGTLFNANDYPTNVVDLLTCHFEPVNVELPDYYKHVSPAEYKAACDQLNRKFEEAAEMQREFVAKMLSNSVEQLVKSVTGFRKGEQRSFQNSVVTNLFAAFDEFREKTKVYGIGGRELEDTVERIRALLTTDSRSNKLRAVDVPDELRRDEQFSNRVTSGLQELTSHLATQTRSRRTRFLMR